MSKSFDDHERMQEIRNEMIELFEEAKDLVRTSKVLSQFDKERAKSYWIGWIEQYLVEEEDAMNNCTMNETIENMAFSDDDENDEEETTEEEEF